MKSGEKYKATVLGGRQFAVDIFADEKTILNLNFIRTFFYFLFEKEWGRMGITFVKMNQS